MKSCIICETDREESTLDEHGRCPFCSDAPLPEPPEEPLPAYLNPQIPKKRPVYTSQPQPQPEPQPESKVDASIPYTAPQYVAATSPQQELANRELARRRLLPFIQRFRPKYLPGWAHEDICRRLERFVKQVELKQSPRLLIMLPPRFGKSEIASRHLAPWALGHHPDWEIIAASHTASLTLSFSRYIRDVMRDPAYAAVFPDASLDPSSQSVENWNLTKGGGYLAAGVGTGITGRGCFHRNTLLQTLTHSDMVPISSIRVGETVYGYDHKEKQLKAVKVIAVSASRTKRQLVTVEDIVCTDDHEFCTSLEGNYTCAGSIHSNMPLMRRCEGQVVEDLPRLLFTNAENTLNGEDLPDVWGEESEPRGSLQGLPHSSASESTSSRTEVRPVRRSLHAESPRTRFRAEEVLGSTHLLLNRVLSGVSKTAHGITRKVRELWGSFVWGAKEVLLSPVLLASSQRVVIDNLVQRGILRHKEVASCTERSRVLNVWAEDLPSGSSPHRPQFGKQCCKQPDVTVLSMSQVVSHSHGVCARELTRYIQDEDGEIVIDIQTETGNFFVGKASLLVHNCHILLLDDLVKDIEAADSQTITDNTWEWYGSTAYTRLAPGGGVLGVMTWWSEQDWAGRIQETMKSGEGDTFEIIKYPAINEDGDEYILQDDHITQLPPGFPAPSGARLTRRQGTAVHPDRYDTEAMLRIKRNLIATGQKRVWQALYQQDPLPDEGILFTKEMLRYGNYQRRQDWRCYQAWDFSITEKRMSDWIACTTIYVTPEDEIIITDVLRFKVDEDGMSLVESMIDQYVEHKCNEIGFEDGQIWKSIKTLFEKRCRERKVYPSYRVLQPLTDKVVRSGPLRGRMQMGKVYIQKNRAWNEAFIRELLHFPGGKHDDMVDSTSYAVRLAMEHTPRGKKQEKPLKSWKDKIPKLGRQGGSHMAA